MSPLVAKCSVQLGILLTLFLTLAGCTEYCWEPFNATCAHNEMILITHAQYGRMKIGRCLVRDYYVGCSTDIVSYMDRKCSGRHTCEVRIPDTELHKVQPCPKDLMSYMEASYSCVPVADQEVGYCARGSRQPLIEAKTTGYLASIVSQQTSLGTSQCPWTIQVPPGQRINVTLLDFAVFDQPSRASNMCGMYATIREDAFTATDITVCGGDRREQPVYLSETNRIQIVIAPPPSVNTPYFAFRYQAVGCRDLPAPAYAWVERQGDKLTLSCNFSGEVSHLVCSGSQWVGELQNCSSGSTKGGQGSAGFVRSGIPFGLVVAVIIGIILGVIIGSMLLGLVLFCQKRFSRPRRMPLQCAVVQESDDIEKARMLGPGNYGYAHVWELQQLRHDQDADPSGEQNTKPDPAQSSGCTDFGAHLGKPPTFRDMSKEHAYESPRLVKAARSPSGKASLKRADSKGQPFTGEFEMDSRTLTPSRQRADRNNTMEARYTD